MTAQTEKKVPALRFPGFNGEWEERSLGHFLSFKNGINASKEQYGRGIKFINVLDILNNDYITYDKITGSVEIDEVTFSKNEVSYGDILFQRSSETREEVGVANVYLDQDKKATFGGFVIRGQRIKKYDPVFMNFLLKTAMTRKEITSKSGGSTRYNVGQEILRSVRIILPTLPEQQEIAAFLTAIETRIQQLTRKVDLLEQYKKGVMQQIFSQEIRFKDDQGRDFLAWEEKRLGEIASKKSSNISANSLEDNNGIYKIYGATGELKSINYYTEEEEYISIVKDGAGVGRTLVCEGKTSVLGTLDIIKPHKNVNLYFLYLLFKQIKFLRYVTGSTIPHIYFKDYSKEKVLVPSLPEQQKIGDFLSAIDRKITYTKDQLDQMQSFKKGLLQQMFV